MFSLHVIVESRRLQIFWFEERFVQKSPFSRMISVDGRPSRKNKAAFSNFSDLKRAFRKFRFRDGLVWMVGLTVEIKLRFRISLI